MGLDIVASFSFRTFWYWRRVYCLSFFIFFQTVATGVNLLMEVTNLHQDTLLEWLIVWRAFALAFLYLLRFSSVVTLLNNFNASFLFFTACAHSSFHQGLEYFVLILPDVLVTY